ncbi:MAG: hypothetical protein R3C14_45645 [Caldilineaceae bacterium]
MLALRRWLQSLLGIGLLVVLFAVLLTLRQNPVLFPPTAPEPPGAVAAVAQAPTPDSPLPTAVLEGTPQPTATPWPTLTPWPTATRRPGPTATPILLPQPADSAAGTLLFAARTTTDGYSASGKILQLQLDAKGQVSSPQEEIGLGWMRSYASWDRTLVAFVDRTMDGERIYIWNSTTEKAKPVAESMNRFGFFLGWHPNNKEIIYLVGESSYGGLWLLDRETGVQTIVVQQDPLYIRDVAISPDGQRIIYAQQKGLTAPGELWTVFADGSEPKLLISGETITGLSWSPDNNRIAYFGNQGLCIISLTNAVCKVVAQNANTGNLFKPVWSPDGHHLAYVADEPDIVPTNMSPENTQGQSQDWDKQAFIGANVHVVDIDTGEEKVLAPITRSEKISGHIDPAWSPDGKLITFAGLHEEQAGVWVVSIEGTDLHQVAEASTLIRFPVWTK